MADKKYNLSISISADAGKAQSELNKTADAAVKVPSEVRIPVSADGCEAVSRQLEDIHKRIRGIRGEFGSGFMTGLFGTSFHNTSFASITGSILGKGVQAAVTLPFKAAFSAVGSLASAAGAAVSSLLLAPVKMLSGAFGVLRGAASGALGVISATVSGFRDFASITMRLVQPAGDFQQYRNSLEVLLKDSEKAARRFNELKEYARETNFNPDEVISAGSRLQAFGLWNDEGMKRLRLAGDLANAFGRSLDEVVTSINYLASGRGGEAFESLSRMGITRDKLKPFGVEFGTSGQMLTEPKKAINALFRYIDRNMGGMTARMGKTLKGAIAQLGGAWQDALGEGLNGALAPLTDFINDLSGVMMNLKSFLRSVDWKSILETPLNSLSGMVQMFGDLANPETRSRGMEALSGVWEGVKDSFSALGKAFWDTGAAFVSGFGTVMSGLFSDIGESIDRMKNDGSWGKITGQFLDGFSEVGIGAVQFLGATLDAFIGKFISGLTVLYEKGNLFSDKEETFKRIRAGINAAAATERNFTPSQRQTYREAENAFVEEGIRSGYSRDEAYEAWYSTNSSIVKKIAPDEFKRNFERIMGWGVENGGMERMRNASTRVSEGIGAILGASKSAWSGMDFSNTRSAASRAGSMIRSAAASSFGEAKDVFLSGVVAPTSARGRQERIRAAEKEISDMQAELGRRIAYKNGIDSSGVFGYLDGGRQRAYRGNADAIDSLRQRISSARRTLSDLRGSTADSSAPASVETSGKDGDAARKNNSDLADMIVERFVGKFGKVFPDMLKVLNSISKAVSNPEII